MKRHDIQYLRFIAISSVIFSFTWPEIFPNAHLGGSLFFVISGYLHCVTFKEITILSFPDIYNFYFKRVRRGLPIYLITLILILIALYLAIWREDIFAIVEVLNASIFISCFMTEYQNEKMLNAFYNSWALTVHLIFSFFFPIAVYFIRKSTRFIMKNGINILIIIICLNLTFLPLININSFFGRLWQFLIGILAYLNPIPKKYSCFWIFLVCIVLLSTLPFIPEPILFQVDIVVTSLCGIVLAFKDEYLYNEYPNFVVKVVYRIGDISFIVYIVAWPLINYCKYIFMLPALDFSIGIGGITSSILVSSLLYHLAEEPLFQFCNTPKRLIVVCGMLYAILVTLLLSFTSSFFVALKY